VKIFSPEIETTGEIPQRFTCDGNGFNPSFEIRNIPKETESLVLIADDPDAPGQTYVHWLVWNISPDIRSIAEDSVPEDGVEGMNSSGEVGYAPPCPPSGKHRYFFRLYALDKKLELPEGSNRGELEDAMAGSVIEENCYMGKYGGF